MAYKYWINNEYLKRINEIDENDEISKFKKYKEKIKINFPSGCGDHKPIFYKLFNFKIFIYCAISYFISVLICLNFLNNDVWWFINFIFLAYIYYRAIDRDMICEYLKNIDDEILLLKDLIITTTSKIKDTEDELQRFMLLTKDKNLLNDYFRLKYYLEFLEFKNKIDKENEKKYMPFEIHDDTRIKHVLKNIERKLNINHKYFESIDETFGLQSYPDIPDSYYQDAYGYHIRQGSLPPDDEIDKFYDYFDNAKKEYYD